MDYKTRITPAKEEAVKALKDEFSQYTGYIFTDYRGMTVEQITKLRRTLMKKDAAYRVVKNRFAKIALTELDNQADDQLVGPTAIALVRGDEANVVAKELFATIKDGSPIQVKGAMLDGKFFTPEEVEAFSKLPTKLELIASLMGTMKAPVQKLAATLLAYVERNGGSVSATEEN
ncbi:MULTISPECIES: 50S ribosomal protein L10 [Sphaerochaeta]|jgi:large subunit ribosomal protein L10|uniref:50S ribosomal protein L10 n=1 Tax=bioreactor metagenome TaxID=1076179 RepID=A0A644VZT1_9ZZZZ|nr:MULTISPECIES: 50S ribosomal protein L10 [Sphaerochaeta]MDT3358787.1 50S ribosomal protein L10 [Spirochaetota bacterium]MDD2394113.1 50S ribosomal protein L10 [Sphaerochaeta sp.]MDD3423570.1 50S ribosomal protein L10 [Sphaerochaeta sp.]MDD3456383.1 50S ribosomal protein L10 [Sphaerochaeta sp.]MDD4037375.1 50S ribosomal protein L10 [Sphaerochaeta sp.]